MITYYLKYTAVNGLPDAYTIWGMSEDCRQERFLYDSKDPSNTGRVEEWVDTSIDYISSSFNVDVLTKDELFLEMI